MIYTGYFAKLKEYLSKDLLPISVARFSPKWYTGLEYKPLAPTSDNLEQYNKNLISKSEYASRYYEHINSIKEFYDVHADLEKLTKKDVILLCYERPEDFCHRHLLANWLNEIKPGSCSGEYGTIRGMSWTTLYA